MKIAAKASPTTGILPNRSENMEKSKKERIREIRKGKSNAKPSVSEDIRKYIMSNLLSVIWSASLLVGGLIFWFYFFQIQYFPDLSFAESGLLLPLAAITGIFFLLLMAVMLIFPYLCRLIMLKAYDSDFDGKGRQNWERVELVWYFLSLFLSIIAIFLNFSKEVEFDFSESDYMLCWIFGNSECVILTLIIVVVVGHINCYLISFKEIWNFIRQLIELLFPCNTIKESKKKEETKQKGNPRLEWFFSSLLRLVPWFFSVLTLLLPLTTLVFIGKQTEITDNADQVKWIVGSFFIVLSANFAFAHYREREEIMRWWVPLIPVFAVFLVFFVAGEPIIPKLVMQKFQLGNYPVERLVLDKEGCKILKSMALKPNIYGKSGDQEGCCLKDIKILSRLGKVFVLEKKIDGKAYNFNIPKDHILAWRIYKKKADGESGNDQTSNSASAKTDTKKKTETCFKDEQAEAS